MSSYIGVAFNPATKKVEVAEYLDDYYGPHRYAVRFEDGTTMPEDMVKKALEAWEKEQKDE